MQDTLDRGEKEQVLEWQQKFNFNYNYERDLGLKCSAWKVFEFGWDILNMDKCCLEKCQPDSLMFPATYL